MGDEGWQMLSDLVTNGMIVSGPNAAALNPVLQGAKAVVFGAVDYISYGRAARGESIEVIVPESGTVIAPRPMMILQSSKQPNAAKAFYDYVLSEEGQNLVAATWMMPARADVQGLRAGINDLTIIEVDGDAVAARRDQILTRFNSSVLNR
jgi:iron(III) transport system substrate-binding protein